MKIGILIAMEKEFSLLKQLLQKEQTLESTYKYTIGNIGKHEVILQQCGVGKVNAAVGTENLINTFSPDLVLSSGVAGGASEDVKPLLYVIIHVIMMFIVERTTFLDKYKVCLQNTILLNQYCLSLSIFTMIKLFILDKYLQEIGL